MIEYIYIALVRFVDNAISTTKNITLYKGKYLISSLLEALSAVLFVFVVVNISANGTLGTTIALAIGAFLGKYIACLVNDRFSKDTTYVNVITADNANVEELVQLYHKCLDHKIKTYMFDSYDIDLHNTLTLMIHAETKAESRVIDLFLADSDAKFLRKII